MITSNICIQAIFIWKQNIFLKNFYFILYSIYCSGGTILPVPMYTKQNKTKKLNIHIPYYPYPIRSRDQWTFLSENFTTIVKFSQIFLSFHIRKMLWYFLIPRQKTFINKNGKWKIPDLDRQIWISVQQPGRLMRDEHTFALLLVFGTSSCYVCLCLGI